MFQYLDTNIILILSFLLTLFIYHKEIFHTFQEIQNSEKKTERIIEDNKRKKKEIHLNDELLSIITKLKKYRKYNENAYDEGYKHLKMFIFLIHDLERDTISHPRQYFENAEFHCMKSLNHFQSISISVPEETYNEALKYNNLEPTKLGNRIGKLCKRLHKHCYYLLYNLSLRLNESWDKDKNIYKNEITMNVDNVQPLHEIDSNWEVY
jgi:hypothetical protein